MKLNREIFHRFFYAVESESGRAKSNTSFDGWEFKSYRTTIGVKTPGKDGRPVLLIADSSFSRTTGEHISALRAACPYPSSHIILVPFTWGGCMVQARILHRRLVTSIHRPAFQLGSRPPEIRRKPPQFPPGLR